MHFKGSILLFLAHITHIHVYLLAILFAVALIAGIFDTLVGGGGLITLPAIMMLGFSPHVALGTNKLQSAFGSGSATLHFLLNERESIHKVWLGIFCTAIGAIIGVIIVLHMSKDNLAKGIPFILMIVLLYAIFSKSFKSPSDQAPKLPYTVFMIIFGLILGAYDALLGPGVGAFWAAALMFFLGFSLRKATIYTKIFNFTSSFVSLAGFIFAHEVVYIIGFVMAAGQFIGGQIGGHFVLTQGHRIIRPIYIIMVTLLLIALSYKTYFAGHF